MATNSIAQEAIEMVQIINNNVRWVFGKYS